MTVIYFMTSLVINFTNYNNNMNHNTMRLFGFGIRQGIFVNFTNH